MELIIGLICVVIAYHVGKNSGCYHILNALHNDRLKYDADEDIYWIEEDDETESNDENSEVLIPIYIEKDNDNYYAYCKETHKFMAKGKDRYELEDALIERFPDAIFQCEDTNMMEVGFIQ